MSKTCAGVPDGGYGWIVVMAAFLTLALSVGFSLSFAVYYVEFLEIFGQSKSLTSAVGSTMRSMTCIAGKT